MDKYKELNKILDQIAKDVDEAGIELYKTWLRERTLIKQILNDVEEVHHAAIMAGDMMYMQKLGTILERYKEVRKDDIGG